MDQGLPAHGHMGVMVAHLVPTPGGTNHPHSERQDQDRGQTP